MTHQIVGEISRLTGHDGLAEEYYMLALAIRERVCGPRHPEVAQSLLHLGALYAEHDLPQADMESAAMEQEKLLEQAEKQFRQALEIYEVRWVRITRRRPTVGSTSACSCCKRAMPRSPRRAADKPLPVSVGNWGWHIS